MAERLVGQSGGLNPAQKFASEAGMKIISWISADGSRSVARCSNGEGATAFLICEKNSDGTESCRWDGGNIAGLAITLYR